LNGGVVQPALTTSLPRPTLLHLSFYLFAFTIPLESLNVSFDLGPISLARLTGLLVFAASFLNIRRCYSAPPSQFWWFLSYLLMFVVTGSFISSEYTPIFITQLFTIVQLLIFFWIASNLLQDERLSRRVLLSFAIAAVLLTVAAQLDVPGFSQTTLTNYQGERLTAIDANPNYLAIVLALAAVILAGMVLNKNLQNVTAKLSLFILMITVLAFMVETGSRAGLAAFVLGMSCYVWPSGLTRRKIVPVVLVVCALLSVGYLLFQDPDSVSRWSDTLFAGDSAGRDQIYTTALTMIAERPFLGWGPVEYQSELAKRNGEVLLPMRDPHNLVLHMLLEVGVFGGLIFLIGIGLCARAAWKSRRGALGILPSALVVTLLVGLQFNNWVTSKPLWLVLAICAAASKVHTSQPNVRRRSTHFRV